MMTLESITESINTSRKSGKGKEYLLPKGLQKLVESILSLDQKSRGRIENELQLHFITKTEEGMGNVCFAESAALRDDYKIHFTPVDLFYYCYAMLHSSSYRKKSNKVFKVDFTQLTYPKESEVFWKLTRFGEELLQVHLLKDIPIETSIATCSKAGHNIIKPNGILFEKVSEKHGKLWINNKQYFEAVPIIAWELHLNDCQPAQQWLEDRKGNKLTDLDILLYRKIITGLGETHRITQEIDKLVLIF